MKPIFFSLLIISTISMAQPVVDGNFNVITNNGNTYSVTIQIKVQSGSANLGNSTIQFSFNDQDLSFPASPSEGTDYSFSNFQGANYTSSVTKSTNTISINIALTGATPTQVTTTSINVCTINFSTLDAAGNSNLNWGLRELFTANSSELWTLGNWPNLNTQPLPVELTSFTASANNDVVNLSWQTATEVNNYGFDVERQVSNRQSSVNSSQSTVGSQWEWIGFVKGSGNSNSPKNYSFTDKNLTGGTIFNYRLKQIDTDGQFEYSDEVEVEVVPAQYSLSQNYPNPFNPVTSIKFELPQAAKVTLSVYNILGEQVASLLNENLEAGFHYIPFNASALPSGTYIYMLQADPESGSGQGFVQTRKMIVLK